MEFSDSEILQAIRKGENNLVLKYLYKKVLPKIRAYIKGNSGDDDEAYDIFQDAIVAFYKYVKLNKFDEQYPIEAFIYSISRNLWINRVKKKNRQVALQDFSYNAIEEEDFSDMLISTEKQKVIKDVLSQLGERCKELLMNIFFHQMTPEEIVEKMGFTNENAVKTKKYKCKQRLIELIQANASLRVFLKE